MSEMHAAQVYTREQFLALYPAYYSYAQKNIHKNMPVVIYITQDGVFTIPESDTASDIWIIVAPRISATLYDWRKGGLNSKAATTILVQSHAHLTYQLIDELPDGLAVESDIAVEVEQGAQAKLFALFAGRAATTYRCIFTGLGAGAQILFRGVYIKQGEQLFTYCAEQRHTIAGVTSDCLLKGVVAGRARVVYKGLIHIGPQAPQSSAFQINKNIVIGNTAQVLTDPQLEVLNNQVSCKHAAAVGPIDLEAIRYLCARGLSKKHAHNLLLEGFLQDVFADPQAVDMRTILAELLQKFLHSASDALEK